MSMRSFYILCRLIVRLRGIGVGDPEIWCHLTMTDLDAEDVTDLMEMTRATD